MEDYYFDELMTVLDQYHRLQAGSKDAEVEEVFIDELFLGR